MLEALEKLSTSTIPVVQSSVQPEIKLPRINLPAFSENKLNDQAPESSETSHIRDISQPRVAYTPADNNVTTHHAEREQTNDVLLATAMVKVQSYNGTTYYLRALIDQGSQGSFVTESAAQFLGLKKIPINCKINGLGDDGRSLNSNNMVLFNAHSRYNPDFETPVKAYVLKTLTRMLPAREVQHENWPHLHQLPLADPTYNKPGKVDLLLGAEVYSEIITDGLKKGPRGSPTAQNTHLGWILSGQLHNHETTQSYTITISMHTYIEDNLLLQRFWEIESDDACKPILTEEEKRCEQFFAETHRRDKERRYIVCLPFKHENPSCQYGSSREIAKKRLLQLERRLGRDEDLKKEYSKVIHEYLDLEHMEEIKDEKEGRKETAVYLPHHAVVRTDKTTTKVRVVHDASCKYKNSVSLNDNLMVVTVLTME
ncbi:uncharacterized protein LOC126381519 [Pectinophora gossypiella]|uniref:uncharacterized protein LOC126381519 n=1 Tax=Pectinophora gossypiella TaxID=13191 RepID=UPI00214ED162|nr:uncharacterized protein LOC126381519 [Pectinophora gossypiella]